MRLICCLALFSLLLFPLNLFAAPHFSGHPEAAVAGVGRFLTDLAAPPEFPRTPGRTAAVASVPVSALVVRVDFEPDLDPQTRRITGSGVWDDPAYAYEGDADYWVKKNSTDLVAYYDQVSRGRLLLQVDIAPVVYRLPGKMAAYGTETVDAIESLIRDSALAVAATGGVSMSGYDILLIVHAGAGEETDVAWDSPDDLWSLFYSTEGIWDDNGQPLVVDGVAINQAIVLPQTGMQDGIVVDPFGIYAHEFAHFLGLPDLYPTSWVSTWAGVGAWCLMGDGIYNRAAASEPWGSSPAHPSAWAKSRLGWTTPQLLAAHPDPGGLLLEPINGLLLPDGSPQILKLPAGPDSSTQFFLLENRQQLGYDQGLPGHGLLVWLIDEEMVESGLVTNSVNNNRWRPGVSLVEADGDDDLRQRLGMASGGDPFPGEADNRMLSPQTTPSSRPTTGPAWINLREIAELDGRIQLTIGFSPPPPVLDDARSQCDWTTIECFPLLTEDLAEYRLYRDDVLLGSSTLPFFELQGSETGMLSLTAVDAQGHESDRSLSFTAIGEECPSKGSSGGGGCFIASAAFGDPDDPAVRQLRLFRDRYLLTHPAGKWLVRMYYEVSPPLARHVQESALLKPVIRALLAPVVLLAALCNLVGWWSLPPLLLALCGIAALVLVSAAKRGVKGCSTANRLP